MINKVVIDYDLLKRQITKEISRKIDKVIAKIDKKSMKNNNPRAKEVKRRPNVKVRLDEKKEKTR